MPRPALSVAASALRVVGVGILFVLVVLSAGSLLTILSAATFRVSLRLLLAGLGVSTLFVAAALLLFWIGSREGSPDSN
jgi:hypothetical protein